MAPEQTASETGVSEPGNTAFTRNTPAQSDVTRISGFRMLSSSGSTLSSLSLQSFASKLMEEGKISPREQENLISLCYGTTSITIPGHVTIRVRRPSTRTMEAVSRVFNTPELLEAILHFLSPRDILLKGNIVCQAFREAIKGSIHLQRRLFLVPENTNKQSSRTWTTFEFQLRSYTGLEFYDLESTVVVYCAPALRFLSKGFASVLIAQPPIKRLRADEIHVSHLHSITDGGFFERPGTFNYHLTFEHENEIDIILDTGVTFGDILRWIEKYGPGTTRNIDDVKFTGFDI